jgi:soluble lytic murein transglycosylase
MVTSSGTPVPREGYAEAGAEVLESKQVSMSKQSRNRAGRLAAVVAAVSLAMSAGAQSSGSQGASSSKKTTTKSSHATHQSSTSGTSSKHGHTTAARVSSKHGAKGHGKNAHVHHLVQPAATAESRKLSRAFVASSQLRPMAQQLVLSRSASAYNGVTTYAAAHPGEAASAANLALGHAYALDRRYPEAVAAFRQADKSDVLADYADFLAAQAAVRGNHAADAVPLLTGFAEKHPGSLFIPNAPLLLAQAYLQMNDSGDALKVLQTLQGTPAAEKVDYRGTLAQAYQASGNTAQAATLYRGIYIGDPVSNEAENARVQLAMMNVPLTAGERKQHADAMFNAKQYDRAAQEYRALKKEDKSLSQADQDALEIYAAVCDLREKRLSRGDVSHLPVTNDDSAALKLYLQSELARNEGNASEHDALVQQLTTSYPQSRWLEEALYSGGNMYLIKRNTPQAIADYVALTEHFPHSTYAPSAHWHAAWLSYRLRRYPDAARLMEEQVVNYPGSVDVPGALYWRGRLYEDVEHNFGQAINFYKALDDNYTNSYYAMLGRQRLVVIGQHEPVAPAPALASVREPDDPGLIDKLPENDVHLIKARLLANAALNEYIRPEIALSPTSEQWGALAEAEIYQSFGENTRALQAMKRSKIPFFSLAVDDVPMAYWELVFPRPYWPQLQADAQANGLDPYLVASLIRQESEFNPVAVSRANAVGLMQLLPSTGKSYAKKVGAKHFSANQLLDPNMNLRLGTADLRASIDRYNGQVEYALASYNAGDTPVRAWIGENDYKDVPEWVESIPYTETRDYVQAILRNREMYRAIYSKGSSEAAPKASPLKLTSAAAPETTGATE